VHAGQPPEFKHINKGRYKKSTEIALVAASELAIARP